MQKLAIVLLASILLAATTVQSPVNLLQDPANPGVLQVQLSTLKACPAGPQSAAGQLVICSDGQGGASISVNGSAPVSLGLAPIPGPVGPVGPAGAQGIQGIQGVAGKDGICQPGQTLSGNPYSDASGFHIANLSCQ